MFTKTADEVGIKATDMVRRDHAKLKNLFDEFEKAKEGAARKNLADTAFSDFLIHSTLEEEIFYPAVRSKIGERAMERSVSEHRAAKQVVLELSGMDPGDEGYDEKFGAFMQDVRRHMEKEETDFLPKIEQSGMELRSLGRRMLERKKELGGPVEVFSERAKRPNHRSRARRASRSIRSGMGARRRGRRKAKA